MLRIGVVFSGHEDQERGKRLGVSAEKVWINFWKKGVEKHWPKEDEHDVEKDHAGAVIYSDGHPLGRVPCDSENKDDVHRAKKSRHSESRIEGNPNHSQKTLRKILDKYLF